MSINNGSSSSASSETDVDQAHEYYEELDNQTLDFRKRKVPTPIPIKSFVKQPTPPPPIVDPIQKLNEQLNRQFRPDLVPSSPSTLSLSPEPVIKRAPPPNPLIFDAHAKRVKPPKKEKEPSVGIKQKFFNRIHQLTESSTKPTIPFTDGMSNQQTTFEGFQVPPGMMLVPMPQQQEQQQSYPRTIEPSQQPPAVSQYKPPTVAYTNSFKNNKVAPPPPPATNIPTVNHVLPSNSLQTPSSMLSTNQLIQTSYLSQQQAKHQQNIFKHIDQSKSSKKKQKKHTDENLSDSNNASRSFALYNQKNGRIEGVVKNRLNIVTDDIDESKIIDDETKPKSKWMLWLSQPLCLGLTRLSGGILFGSMILLGCASFAGLIAASVLYTQDSTTDAQWKILGIVVCAIMLITIIITLLVFFFCYKQGYMFDKDEDIDRTDPSTTLDREGNEHKKAFLRKIYKFNRPNETTPVPVNMLHHVTTSPLPMLQPSVHVNDKQTNTETTIAMIRPKDIDRGVWPSSNAYGGISYRPLIPPQMTSRFIQVFQHEIDELMQPQQIIYQVVAPAAAIPPPQIQPRIIQIPAQQAPMIELVEAPQKPSRTIQMPAQQGSIVEYVETTQKQPRTIQMPVQPAPIVEYVETTQKQPRTTIIRQPQTEQIIMQPTTRIEYIDMEDRRGRRIAQQPQYEIVEEIIDQTTSSPIEEYMEIVDAPRRKRYHEKKKDRKHGFGKVSVKHLKSSD